MVEACCHTNTEVQADGLAVLLQSCVSHVQYSVPVRNRIAFALEVEAGRSRPMYLSAVWPARRSASNESETIHTAQLCDCKSTSSFPLRLMLL